MNTPQIHRISSSNQPIFPCYLKIHGDWTGPWTQRVDHPNATEWCKSNPDAPIAPTAKPGENQQAFSPEAKFTGKFTQHDEAIYQLAQDLEHPVSEPACATVKPDPASAADAGTPKRRLKKDHSWSCEYPEGCSCGASAWNDLLGELAARDAEIAQIKRDNLAALKIASMAYDNETKARAETLAKLEAVTNRGGRGSLLVENAKLTERLTAARKDGERLDWLEDNPTPIDFYLRDDPHGEPTFPRWLIQSAMLDKERRWLRDAIDAAMSTPDDKP